MAAKESVSMNDISVPTPEGVPVSELTAPQAYLRIQDLTKRFGSFTALDRINLDIPQGEFVCFLGPSGCGKTTLLRAIAGLDQQNEGSIFIGGRDVSYAEPAQRDFGIVFQSYALFPNLTVNRNVAYGLVNRKWSHGAIQARVDELLSLVGLPEQGNKYPVQLSGGQQQRVALARALATSPGLLLLDEPLSALDAKVRVRLRSEIRALQKRLGVTTVMVTHDQEEALAMADRIVVMNNGRIEQVGGPETIYCKPETAFVSDFVGHMTFLDATVLEHGLVRVGALVLAVADTRGFSPGVVVKLAMRPEEVRTRGIDSSTTNAFEARVESLSFLGAFCRATLDPIESPGTKIAVDFSTNAMRDLGIRIGQTQLVAFPPDALRIFPLEPREMRA
jgi:iron(III) transport system ATP-binding protein